MKSEIGALLTRIAAIINFIIASLVFIGGIVSILGITFYQGIPFNLMIMFFVMASIFFVLGMLMLNSSKKMQNPKTVKNGTIWAIVLGVITIQFFTGILSLIGGIIALIDSEK